MSGGFPARPWATPVLIYPAIEARVGGMLRSRTIRRAVSGPERDANRTAIDAIPAAVSAWSDGVASMDPFVVRELEQPLRSITRLDNGSYWAAPADCRDVMGAGYDSVIVVWPSDGSLELCGWGCTTGASAESFGAGFSSIVSDWWHTYADRLHPEEGFVHEWLHQVEAVFRSAGAGADVFPDLHDAGHSRSCRPEFTGTYGEHESRTGTWQPWYHDLMTGRVRRPEGSGCYGITRELWESR